MPDLPEVHIAALERIRVSFQSAEWRTRPGRTRRVKRGTDFRQNAVKDFLVIIPERGWQIFTPSPIAPGRVNLVVADPDDDARMIPQTLDVINRFGANVI